MHCIVVILCVFAFQSDRVGGKPTVPDLSGYPQTYSFRHYVSVHTNAVLKDPYLAGSWDLQHTNLLVISAFPDGDRYAVEYFVTESGLESDRRRAEGVLDGAIQSPHWKQLSETNLTNLRLAIRQVPENSVPPPIERLVIVSFREGTNWITRSYDSAALPKPMRQIYDIIGERFESKKEK